MPARSLDAAGPSCPSVPRSPQQNTCRTVGPRHLWKHLQLHLRGGKARETGRRGSLAGAGARLHTVALEQQGLGSAGQQRC